MAESLAKNFIDYEEYPQSADIQNRCVSMIARMFNAPTHTNDESAVGTSCVGSSEAIMLATLAMKRVSHRAIKLQLIIANDFLM
jgi:glutamate decarboxylase